jgi:hypothetical protein
MRPAMASPHPPPSIAAKPSGAEAIKAASQGLRGDIAAARALVEPARAA